MLPEAPFDQFILQNADGIMVVDRNGVTRFVNPTAELIFGRPANELLGQLFGFPIVFGETTELDILRRDKQRIIAEMRVVETEWAGEAVYLACIRDITERKWLEEKLRYTQKMEAVGRLAGGIAHDFNNLLTVINGYADLLLHEPAIRTEIQHIKSAGEHAATLTRQLLAFSRHQILNPQIFNLNHIITDLEKALHHLLGDNILLIIKLKKEGGYVKVDRGQIEQAIFNLAINAREAMPQGGSFILETSNVEIQQPQLLRYETIAPGPYVQLSIRDNGPGIPPKDLSYIFEPFFTTKRPGQGSGLGLAMVHGIINQSGGHIQVDSQIGHGTTFQILLPRLFEQPAPAINSVYGRETILVIEDDPQLRQLMVRTLTQYGYQALEASHWSTALAIYQQASQPIHLLLTNVLIPELTQADNLKVLYTLAYSNDGSTPLPLAQPAPSFIEKPFSTTNLIQKIRQILDAP